MMLGGDGLDIVTVFNPLLELQPDAVSVNINVALPFATPVTIPPEVTVAIVGFSLTHVPPTDGDNCVMPPMHIWVVPATEVVGLPFTTIGEVLFDVHPVALLVNANLAMPCAIPVTIPPDVILAIVGFLLSHIPPLVGLNWVVPPMHIVDAPVNVTIGLPFTFTLNTCVDEQPVVEFVNIKVAVPAAAPITRPLLLTVAILVFELDQTPPVVGASWVVFPIHISALPRLFIAGISCIVKEVDASDTQPVF
jgi:hypothetical protein